MDTMDHIRDQALQLNESERATLARDFLASLESGETQSNAPSDWAAEIEARSDAVARGRFSATDWRESVERIRNQLAQKRGS